MVTVGYHRARESWGLQRNSLREEGVYAVKVTIERMKLRLVCLGSGSWLDCDESDGAGGRVVRNRNVLPAAARFSWDNLESRYELKTQTI